MARAHVGDDGHARTRHLGKPLDLVGMVHAHLHHEHLCVGGSLEQRDGHANEVVVVAGRGVDLEAGGEGCLEHILGGGLAHRPRHAHDAPILPRAPPRGEAQHELAGVVGVGAKYRGAGLGGLGEQGLARLAREHDGRRARLERLGHEVVAVDALAAEGDEEPVSGDLPRVDRDARDARVTGAGNERAAGGRDDI